MPKRKMGQLPRPAPLEMRVSTRVAGTHQKRPPCTVEGFVLPARERDFQTSRNIRLRETPMGRAHHAGSQHRSHIRHPFHVDLASPTKPQTPTDQSTHHYPPKAGMATRPRPTEAPAQAHTRRPNPALARVQLPRTSQQATQCPSRPRPQPPGPAHPRARALPSCPAAPLPYCPAALRFD